MAQDTRSHLNDIDLAAAIAAALQFTVRVPSTVTVAVSHAIVTLEGTVDTRDQRAAAEAVVRRFPGVL